MLCTLPCPGTPAATGPVPRSAAGLRVKGTLQFQGLRGGVEADMLRGQAAASFIPSVVRLLCVRPRAGPWGWSGEQGQGPARKGLPFEQGTC